MNDEPRWSVSKQLNLQQLGRPQDILHVHVFASCLNLKTLNDQKVLRIAATEPS